jgi:hypothetical protein
VRAEWDVAGLTMERKVWTDPRVEAAARPFVALRLGHVQLVGYQDADKLVSTLRTAADE